MQTIQATPAAPAAVKTMAIVPGDRISTTRKDVITYETLLAAVKKRYRNEMPWKDFVMNTLDKGFETMKEAVDDCVAQHVARDGHDRNVILTQAELQERAFKMEAEGVMIALINRFKSGGRLSENDIKAVVRQQVSMRKINRDPERLAGILVRTLKDEKFIAITGIGRNMGYELSRGRSLPSDEYVKFYKFALRIE
jgi:hypothetical protein